MHSSQITERQPCQLRYVSINILRKRQAQHSTILFKIQHAEFLGFWLDLISEFYSVTFKQVLQVLQGQFIIAWIYSWILVTYAKGQQVWGCYEVTKTVSKVDQSDHVPPTSIASIAIGVNSSCSALKQQKNLQKLADFPIDNRRPRLLTLDASCMERSPHMPLGKGICCHLYCDRALHLV